MQPAAACYRKKEYRKARTILSGLDPAIRELPLWRVFDQYLHSLTGWLFNKKVAKVTPTGSPEDVEALYLLLVGQEIAFSRLMLVAQQFEVAAKALEQAQQFAPHYGYLQFLRGVSIYEHMGHEMADGNHPPMETVCYRLQDARAFATLALELGYKPAHVFNQVLQSILEPLEAIVAPPNEAKRINALVEEFAQAMKLAGDGLTSIKHLKKVYNAIRAVGKRCETLRGRMRSKAAIDTLSELAKAVERHCQQLDNLRQDFKDSKIAKKLFAAFKKKMDQNQKRPIANRAEQTVVRDFFLKLKNKVETDRRLMRSDRAKKDVDQLLQIIARVLQQL
jgi:hypothetical protein